ncbi:hypothetical protein GS429_04425 [Natronorubrum sp. JWXQ-INN-674]|uniref:Uncharacterized protein n=1 Tax=Natronorubrum halalkaliphilum TaxID=2691917 RepID=A0A6B0VHK2_9EURY|nr:DUF5787 family protein [Natronorubrum halalkaliphilum]MXV61321.1 hypothetical protein [Natronorubrum halalkaliphilum]
MSEFAFELELCAHLETRRDGVLARQLGASVADPGGRILDVLCVEPGPEFDDRVRLTSESIPDAAIESAVGTGRARYWKTAFDCHPDRARSATERACEIGFFEREHRKGRDYVRQVARYPDWYGRIVGIENKPDLGRPGDLEAQLRTDVSLALVDEVILATESYVTRAHLNRIPEEVGVWRVHREDGAPLEIEIVREPTSLPVDEPGIEPLEAHPGRTEIAVVDPDAKARQRRRIAERTYGKGWRTYEFPDCGACDPDDSSGATLPYCEWKGRIVDAGSECGASCGGYDPVSDADTDTDADSVPDSDSDTDPELHSGSALESDADSATAIDLEAERDRRTPWKADPDGKRRQQSGLDQFG